MKIARTLNIILLAWVVLILARPVRAASRAECQPMPSTILGHPVGYCAILPPSYDADKTRRYPVLYFLHGLGENEQILVTSGGMTLIDDLWNSGQLGEFIIVTPAAGSSFYINSFSGRVRYEDFLIQEFFPFIEKRYRVRPGREGRGISGVSMGGYGALRLAFRHPALFNAVSAHSAALVESLPAAITNDPLLLRALGNAFGSPPNPAFWDRNTPSVFARTANLAGLKIYFDCGADDELGFAVGTRALDKLLTSRHIPHEAHIYPGGHSWDYFAAHIAASLEFHSRAFGLTAMPGATASPH
jgi:S-formylglutathione hydrolase FrmB